MYITKDGSFTYDIDPEDLAKGLRPSKYSSRNKKFLIECIGAIGYEESLQTLDGILDNFRLINTNLIADGFPYPQVFTFINHIIVCGKTDIYESVGSVLIHKLTVAAGIRWSAIDFYDYIYMSNGKVSVVRSASDQNYTISDLPVANAICNFNGQVMIGVSGVC